VYSSLKKVSYYIYMTRSKRRNENGKRRRTRRTKQRGAGKMMQSALTSLSQIRKASEYLDNQIDIIINNNYTFSDSEHFLPEKKTIDEIAIIPDAKERFEKAQEANKVNFKNQNPFSNFELMNKLNVMQAAAKRFRIFRKFASAKVKLLGVLSLRRTIKKSPEQKEELMAYKKKITDAMEAQKAQLAAMTPDNRDQWLAKKKATSATRRQQEYDELEKKVQHGGAWWSRTPTPLRKPIEAELYDSAASGRGSDRELLKDARADPGTVFWDPKLLRYRRRRRLEKEEPSQQDVLKELLPQLNQNLQLQAFILGLFTDVRNSDKPPQAGDADYEQYRKKIFGAFQPELCFTIEKNYFEVLVCLLLYDAKVASWDGLVKTTDWGGGANASEWPSFFKNFLESYLFGRAPRSEEKKESPFFPPNAAKRDNLNAKLLTNKWEMPTPPTVEHETYTTEPDKWGNILRIPASLDTAEKLHTCLGLIINSDPNSAVHKLKKGAGIIWEEMSVDRLAPRARALQGFVELIFYSVCKQWFNYSFASVWGSEIPTVASDPDDDFPILNWKNDMLGMAQKLHKIVRKDKENISAEKWQNLNEGAGRATILLTHFLKEVGGGEILGKAIESALIDESCDTRGVCSEKAEKVKKEDMTTAANDFDVKVDAALQMRDGGVVIRSLGDAAYVYKKFVTPAAAALPPRVDASGAFGRFISRGPDGAMDWGAFYNEVMTQKNIPEEIVKAFFTGVGAGDEAAGTPLDRVRHQLKLAYLTIMFEKKIRSTFRQKDPVGVYLEYKKAHENADRNSIKFYLDIKALGGVDGPFREFNIPAPIYVKMPKKDWAKEEREVHKEGVVEPEEIKDLAEQAAAEKAAAALAATTVQKGGSRATDCSLLRMAWLNILAGAPGEKGTFLGPLTTVGPGDIERYRMTDLGGINGQWFSSWLACQCPYPPKGGSPHDVQFLGSSSLGKGIFGGTGTTIVPKGLNGSAAAWKDCANLGVGPKEVKIGKGAVLGSLVPEDALLTNPASCMILTACPGAMAKLTGASCLPPMAKRCPAGQPIEYNIYIWQQDKRIKDKVGNTKGYIFIPPDPIVEHGVSTFAVDYSKGFAAEAERDQKISLIYNVGKAIIGVTSTALGLYAGPGAGILAMAGWAPASLVGILNFDEGTTDAVQKANAAASGAWNAKWENLQDIGSWVCASASAGAANVGLAFGKVLGGEKGKALYTDRAEYELAKRNRQMTLQRKIDRHGVGTARSLLVNAAQALMQPSKTSVEMYAADKRKLITEERGLLRHYSEEYQEYYMYIIRIRVGIIYQMRMNIAVLEALQRCFLTQGANHVLTVMDPAHVPAEVAVDINHYQIARINQLINFGQRCMGGPGAGWDKALWTKDFMLFKRVERAAAEAPGLENNPVWREYKDFNEPVRAFLGAGQGADAFKKYLPGVFNYATKTDVGVRKNAFGVAPVTGPSGAWDEMSFPVVPASMAETPLAKIINSMRRVVGRRLRLGHVHVKHIYNTWLKERADKFACSRRGPFAKFPPELDEPSSQIFENKTYEELAGAPILQLLIIWRSLSAKICTWKSEMLKYFEVKRGHKAAEAAAAEGRQQKVTKKSQEDTGGRAEATAGMVESIRKLLEGAVTVMEEAKIVNTGLADVVKDEDRLKKSLAEDANSEWMRQNYDKQVKFFEMGQRIIYVSLINNTADIQLGQTTQQQPILLRKILVWAKIEALTEFIVAVENETLPAPSNKYKLPAGGGSKYIWNLFRDHLAQDILLARRRHQPLHMARVTLRRSKKDTEKTLHDIGQKFENKTAPETAAGDTFWHASNTWFNANIGKLLELPMVDEGDKLLQKTYQRSVNTLYWDIADKRQKQLDVMNSAVTATKEQLQTCCKGLRSDVKDNEDREALVKAVNWDFRTDDIHEYQAEAHNILQKLESWVDIDFDKLLMLNGWQALGAWYSIAPPICWRKVSDIESDIRVQRAAEDAAGHDTPAATHLPRSGTNQDLWIRFEGWPDGPKAKAQDDCGGSVAREWGVRRINQNPYWWWGSSRNAPCDAKWKKMITRAGLIRGVDNKVLPMGGMFFKATEAVKSWQAIKQWSTRSADATAGGVAADVTAYTVATLQLAVMPPGTFVQPQYIYKQTWDVTYRKIQFWYLSYFLSNHFLYWGLNKKGALITVAEIDKTIYKVGEVRKKSDGWVDEQFADGRNKTATFCYLRNLFRKLWMAGYFREWGNILERQEMMAQIIEQATWWCALLQCISKNPAAAAEAASRAALVKSIIETVQKWRAEGQGQVGVAAPAAAPKGKECVMKYLKAFADVSGGHLPTTKYIYDYDIAATKLDLILKRIAEDVAAEPSAQAKWWEHSLKIQSVITDNIEFFWPNHNPSSNRGAWWVFGQAKTGKREGVSNVCLLDKVMKQGNDLLKTPPCISVVRAAGAALKVEEAKQKAGAEDTDVFRAHTTHQRRKCCLRCAVKLAVRGVGVAPVVSELKDRIASAAENAKVAREGLATIVEDFDTLLRETESQVFLSMDEQNKKELLDLRSERFSAGKDVTAGFAAAAGVLIALPAIGALVGGAGVGVVTASLVEAVPGMVRSVEQVRDFVQKPSVATLGSAAQGIINTTEAFKQELKVRTAVTAEAKKAAKKAARKARLELNLLSKGVSDEGERKGIIANFEGKVEKREKAVKSARESVEDLVRDGAGGGEEAKGLRAELSRQQAELAHLKNPKTMEEMVNTLLEANEGRKETTLPKSTDLVEPDFFGSECMVKARKSCLEGSTGLDIWDDKAVGGGRGTVEITTAQRALKTAREQTPEDPAKISELQEAVLAAIEKAEHKDKYLALADCKAYVKKQCAQDVEKERESSAAETVVVAASAAAASADHVVAQAPASTEGEEGGGGGGGGDGANKGGSKRRCRRRRHKTRGRRGKRSPTRSRKHHRKKHKTRGRRKRHRRRKHKRRAAI